MVLSANKSGIKRRALFRSMHRISRSSATSRSSSPFNGTSETAMTPLLSKFSWRNARSAANAGRRINSIRTARAKSRADVSMSKPLISSSPDVSDGQKKGTRVTASTSLTSENTSRIEERGSAFPDAIVVSSEMANVSDLASTSNQGSFVLNESAALAFVPFGEPTACDESFEIVRVGLPPDGLPSICCSTSSGRNFKNLSDMENSLSAWMDAIDDAKVNSERPDEATDDESQSGPHNKSDDNSDEAIIRYFRRSPTPVPPSSTPQCRDRRHRIIITTLSGQNTGCVDTNGSGASVRNRSQSNCSDSLYSYMWVCLGSLCLWDDPRTEPRRRSNIRVAKMNLDYCESDEDDSSTDGPYKKKNTTQTDPHQLNTSDDHTCDGDNSSSSSSSFVDDSGERDESLNFDWSAERKRVDLESSFISMEQSLETYDSESEDDEPEERCNFRGCRTDDRAKKSRHIGRLVEVRNNNVCANDVTVDSSMDDQSSSSTIGSSQLRPKPMKKVGRKPRRARLDIDPGYCW